jgi:hypothetical protein
MAKKWDFTQKSQGSAEPQQPKRIIAGPPLPPGKPVRAKHLTEGEKEILQKLDLDPNEPIPENIAQLAEQIRKQEEEQIAKEFEEHKQKRTFRWEPPTDVADATADIQKSVTDGLKAYEQLYGVDKPEEKNVAEDELKQAEKQLNVQQVDLPDDTAAKKANELLPHVDERTINAYLNAICLGDVFVHEFSIFGDRVHVRFRTLRVSEMQPVLLAAQSAASRHKAGTNQDITSALGVAEWAWRYRFALQLVSVYCGDEFGIQADFPDSLEGWQKWFGISDQLQLLEKIRVTVVEEVIRGEILFNALNACFAEFQNLCNYLADNRYNEKFFR